MSGYLKLVAFAAATTIGGLAHAEEISARCDGMVAYAPGAVLCGSRVSVDFTSAGPSTVYAIRISTPVSACSDTSFVVYSDRPVFRSDTPVGIAYSYRLRPGQSQIVAIGSGFAAGDSHVEIGAIRYDGACTGRAALLWRAAVAVQPVTS